MTTGSARPLEDAFRSAHQQMVLWVAGLTGQSTIDSYQLVSQAALTPIANVVDTNYTVVCKIPKAVLGAIRPMDGMHETMRKAAAQWRG
jgi:amidase